MKSHYNFFEVREVSGSDEFANYSNIGFIAPIKIRFKNDWKFCFVYDWDRINVGIHEACKLEACKLANAYNANNCHLYLTQVNK